MNNNRTPFAAPARQDAGTRSAVDLPRVVFAIGTQLLLIGGSLYVLHPFAPALIWGTMIVVATWPALIALQRLLRGRRAPAVLIMLLALIVVVVLPIYGAVSTLADHAADITNFVKALPEYALPSPPEWLERVPIVGARISREWQALSDAGPGGVLAKLQPYVSMATSWMLARVSQIGLFVLHLVFMLIVCGLLYAKGESGAHLATRFAERVSPQSGAAIVDLVGKSIRAIALGVVVTAFVQSSLGALGIWMAGVPFAGVLSALLLIVCLVQIGPLLPLLGCVTWVFMNGSQLAAILLLIWSIAVTMIDNVVRPILIRRSVSLPMVLIIAGVLGGLLSIGVVGLFVGPVILAVTYHVLLAWIGAPQPSATQTVAAVAADAQTPDPAARE